MKIKLLSYNIQSWDKNPRRVEGIIDLINRHNPDVICFQEITISWFKELRNRLGEIYTFTGRDRYHGDQKQLKRDRERNCVAFKKDKFLMKWSHTYWMGPDMNHPSKFEESVFNRVFTAVSLVDIKTNQRFQCISTHLDYDLPVGRKKQAEVLLGYIKKQKGNLLLAGDFNSEPKEDAYHMIADYLIDVGKEFNEENITYHAYDKFPHERIDFIFRSKDIKAEKFLLVKDKYQGLPPSDHYPVEAILNL